MAYQTTGPSPIRINHLCAGWQIEAYALNILSFGSTLEEAVAKFAIAFKDIYEHEKSHIYPGELGRSDMAKAIQKIIQFVD